MVLHKWVKCGLCRKYNVIEVSGLICKYEEKVCNEFGILNFDL